MPRPVLRVLFLCTGNICRSPTAHAVFMRDVVAAGLSAKIEVDSAGTSAYHVGEMPDARTVAVALRHGVDMRRMRARQFSAQDWGAFDLILVAGRDHLLWLSRQMPAGWPGQLQLILDDEEVPDPYYGGDAGFEEVFARLESASQMWLARLRARLLTT